MNIGGYRRSFRRPNRVGGGGLGNFAGSTTVVCRHFGLTIHREFAYSDPFPTIDRNVSGRQKTRITYTTEHVIAGKHRQSSY